jgi:hypothetical protein
MVMGTYWHMGPPGFQHARQENQGMVSVPQPLPCIVCDLNCGDVSTGDNDNDDIRGEEKPCAQPMWAQV